MNTPNRVPLPTLQLGNTAIAVQNNQFRTGYRKGYQAFHRHHANKPLVDWHIYTFIMSNIADETAPCLENAGYVTGWLAALLEDSQATQMKHALAETTSLVLTNEFTS